MSIPGHPKTQILITDVSKAQFTKEWPKALEEQLFKTQFPELKKHCTYYTPLAFLNRIVIIFDDEQATLKVYEYLDKNFATDGIKLYLTESLLGKPRARSHEDLSHALHEPANVEPAADFSSPCGSPSLSPESVDVSSPTALKFPGDEKMRLYKEPPPKSDAHHHDSTSNSFAGETQLLHKPQLSLDVSSVKDSRAGPSTPVSPSITLNEFDL
ncbi:LAMI_0H06216g1_1 [Lachancea mirantina]|uniref:LAMI_0H06216g1_1 n=1 Tax=Lachancea mirantina TaxID=1230905 RepID=A0A1G4KFE1_9SACH|nr:LAMI_0H06216g1_1 [Lachancea mirantina]